MAVTLLNLNEIYIKLDDLESRRDLRGSLAWAYKLWIWGGLGGVGGMYV